jgi:hypothetical protein
MRSGGGKRRRASGFAGEIPCRPIASYGRLARGRNSHGWPMSTYSTTALAATMLDDEAWDDLLELHRGTGVIATDSGLGLLLE